MFFIAPFKKSYQFTECRYNAPMNVDFSQIGLFTKPDDASVKPVLLQLANFLQKQAVTIYADKHSAAHLDVKAHLDKSIHKHIGCAIVVGGDGTLLKVGRLLSEQNIPVIGINLGRLGFLVDISPDQIEQQLSRIFQGHHIPESRTLLAASAMRDGKKLGDGIALNDIVVHVRNDIRMIEFTTHIDGDFVNTQRADGIVVATPTGSTAYALSGGGPILHPSLDALALVPICPHTLSNRPVVINHKSRIEISLCETRHVNARLSFDGQANINLRPGDKVIIEQRDTKLQLLHPDDHNYYRILRNKLGWSVSP